MKHNITLLMHGPHGDNAYQEIFDAFKQWNYAEKEHIQIVVVCYVSDKDKIIQKLENIGVEEARYQLIEVPDLINPGFFNINRQIASVKSGLAVIAHNQFVIKLRNDQWVDFNALEKELDRLGWLEEDKEKMITTNCFTRSDRLYHPSDMFMCAWYPELKQYYDAPLMTETHMDCQMRIITAVKNGEDFKRSFMCPEIWLCQHYLKQKGWDLLFTEEDSFQAIQTYFRVLNSWDIGFRWKKERTPTKGVGAIILPQYFTCAPFANVPEEHIACYSRADFEGQLTEKDRTYIAESKKIWKSYEDEVNGRLPQRTSWQRFMAASFRACRKIIKFVVIVIGCLAPYCITKWVKNLWRYNPLIQKIKNKIRNKLG